MKMYISGPITGLSKEEYEAKFQEAEKYLLSTTFDMRLAGNQVKEIINPCNLAHKYNATYADYMRVDLQALLGCDGIYMLAGWQNSEGARTEHEVARICGLHIHYQAFAFENNHNHKNR